MVFASVVSIGSGGEFKCCGRPNVRPIPEWVAYGACRCGTVWRLRWPGRQRPCRTTEHWFRYQFIQLHENQRVGRVRVHRAVALAHLGPPPFPGAQVNHIDGDVTNNCVENLRWVSASENQRAAAERRRGRATERTRITDAEAEAIRSLASRGVKRIFETLGLDAHPRYVLLIAQGRRRLPKQEVA